LLRPFAGPNLTPFSRRTLLARLPDTWRDLPEFGRLSLRIDPGDPVRMFETRAFPFIVGRDEWDADELSIAVAVRRLAVRLSPKPAVDSNVAIVAVIGLHGLARRYERGDDISDEAVLRDLEVLTDARAWRTGIRDSRSEFDVPVTGGCWRGAAAMLDGQPALAVRTFVA
jgi:hypothetical protein